MKYNSPEKIGVKEISIWDSIPKPSVGIYINHPERYAVAQLEAAFPFMVLGNLEFHFNERDKINEILDEPLKVCKLKKLLEWILRTDIDILLPHEHLYKIKNQNIYLQPESSRLDVFEDVIILKIFEIKIWGENVEEVIKYSRQLSGMSKKSLNNVVSLTITFMVRDNLRLQHKSFRPRYTLEDIKGLYTFDILKLKDFFSSSSNLLILLGPPGTGKTRLIEGLFGTALKEELWPNTNEVLYAFHSQVMKDVEFWTMAMDYDLVILDDCDVLLTQREEEENSPFHSFSVLDLLRFSDGLIPMNPKIIMVSNKSSVTIDEALLRDGRTFSVVQFDYFKSIEEAELAVSDTAKYLGLSLSEDEAKDIATQLLEKYNGKLPLAAIFRYLKKENPEQHKKSVNRQIGFFQPGY